MLRPLKWINRSLHNAICPNQSSTTMRTYRGFCPFLSIFFPNWHHPIVLGSVGGYREFANCFQDCATNMAMVEISSDEESVPAGNPHGAIIAELEEMLRMLGRLLDLFLPQEFNL